MPSRNERDSERSTQLVQLHRALSEVELGRALGLVRGLLQLSQAQMAERLGWDQPSIARIESGQRRTIYDVRTLLSVVDTLGISRGVLLPIFTNTTEEVIKSAIWQQLGVEPGILQSTLKERDSVNRKEFLSATFGLGLGVVAASGEGRSVDGEHGALTDIAAPIIHYRRIEQDVVARDLVQPVASHLELSRRIVRARGSSRSGLALLAEAAGLSAWLAMDSGDHGMARQRYAEAVRYSQESDMPLLTAYMTASFAQFAIESGASVQGLKYLDAAWHSLDTSAPASAHAWMASLRAVTHAHLGDKSAVHSALSDAQRLTSSDETPVWPWVFPFTEAKAARYQSVALARIGDVQSATVAYRDALPAMAAPKTRALALLEQSRMFVEAQQLGEGCASALEALDIGRSCGSERIISGVLSLRASLPLRSIESKLLDDALEYLY